MALIPWWIRYPNVNDEIMNLDWLLKVSNENTDKISNFINLNTIKYADPILWDITSQYEANTITVDPQTGDAYISTKAVPYGVSLSNTDYWTKIYNYADEINKLEEQIAAANERLSTTATAPRAKGDLVWLNGLLYEVTAPMIAGDSYVVDSNCKKVTVEEIIKLLNTAISNEATARENADLNLQTAIDDEVTARENADTELLNTMKALNAEIPQANANLTGLVIAEYFTNYHLNGCCYIGGGNIVYYCSHLDDNNGELVCFNILTYTEQWRYTLAAYHGNSLTYNPDTNEIIICNAMDNVTLTPLLPELSIVKLSNPSVIDRTVTLDRGCYSITYNPDTKLYYAICARGSIAGECNNVRVYDGNFNYIKNFNLEQYIALTGLDSGQGCQLCIGDKIYSAWYGPTVGIQEHDINTGKLLNTYLIDKTISQYSNISEMQSIYYNFDDDIIGISYAQSTSLYNEGIAFCNLNLKGRSFLKHKQSGNLFRSKINVTVNNGAFVGYKPCWVLGYFTDIKLALNYMATFNSNYYSVSITGAEISSELVINGIHAEFGGGVFNNLKINTSRCVFIGSTFKGNVVNGDGFDSNITIINSDVCFNNSTFNNASVYGVRSSANAVINFLHNCTFTDGNHKHFMGDANDVSHSNVGICPTINSGLYKRSKLFSGVVAGSTSYDMIRSIFNLGTIKDLMLDVYLGGVHYELFSNAEDVKTCGGSIYWFESPIHAITKIKITITSATTFRVDYVYQSTDGGSTWTARPITTIALYMCTI